MCSDSRVQERRGWSDLVMNMKGEEIEVVDEGHTTQIVVINGQQYQVVSPALVAGLMVEDASHVSQDSSQSFTQPAESTMQYPTSTSGGHNTSSHHIFIPAEQGNTRIGQDRKREIRLMKNKEAAHECRIKKKQYIMCLENRVAVLENQNKALIEELKSLKELYTENN